MNHFRFEAEGALRLDAVNFDQGGRTDHQYRGSYAVTPQATVQYAWDDTDTGRIEAENSLTVVEGRALELGHPCCARAHERFWTHRGYLADDPARTRFRREALRRELDASGTITSSLQTRVDLAFSAAPAELVSGTPCLLDVFVRIEWSEADAVDEREFQISLECTARRDGGLFIILVPGRDWVALDDRSLAESPFPPISKQIPDGLLALLAHAGTTPVTADDSRKAQETGEHGCSLR